MEFDKDSKLYAEDPYTVTEIISSALDSENCTFSNSIYREIYNLYLQLYDQGLDQDTIVRTMLNSPDRALAAAVSELAIDKYTITVKSFAESLTAKGSWLVQYVPKTLQLYAQRRKEVELDSLVRALAGTVEPEEQMELMKKIVDIQKSLKSGPH